MHPRTNDRSVTRALRRTLAALVVSWGLAACLATPIPDPPSLEVSRMMLVQASASEVRITGSMGAVRPGGRALRVTNPAAPAMTASVAIYTAADGSFGATLAGTTADTLFLEGLSDTADTFEVAVRLESGSVVSTSAGGDRDLDGSPDMIDCAPDDRMQSGQRCGMACATDTDCAAGQICVSGLCTVSMCDVAEICGNGTDDDCDGLTDDGC